MKSFRICVPIRLIESHCTTTGVIVMRIFKERVAVREIEIAINFHLKDFEEYGPLFNKKAMTSSYVVLAPNANVYNDFPIQKRFFKGLKLLFPQLVIPDQRQSYCCSPGWQYNRK